MPFVKVVKNKAYFKRYQVKFRRRRQGKTDYRARKRLIMQYKNKYSTPRYRLVVRFSNKDIIVQVTFAKLTGDIVLASATSRELRRYGLKVGFTNYASAYTTGLLLGRRLLSRLGLADKYKGQEQVTGEDYTVKVNDEGPRPFKALLDVGLSRTSTGARIFAVLKGALDAGLNIPHSETHFAGYKRDAKKLDAALLRKYIFGGHVADYMKLLEKDNPDRYRRQFSQYVKLGVKPSDIEPTYKKLHAAVRADPSPKKDAKDWKAEKLRFRARTRLSYAQRKDRIRQKLASKAKAADSAQ
jgi:large subunit ribosomal protein L5e